MWAFRVPCEQPRPYAPRQQNQRIGVISAQEQRIVFAKPFFERREASAILSRLHFRDRWRLIVSEEIKIDVMPSATKPTGAGQRIPFCVNADSAVRLDDLALNAIALPAMASTAHGRPRISASASLARVKFTMSENVPSVRFSRYMPGNAVSGTRAT